MAPFVTPSELQQALDVLEQRLGSLIRQGQGEVWHAVGAPNEPAFQNSWVNVGGAYETAAFRLVNPKLGAMKGSVKGGVALTTLFTLPAAYRPAAERRFPAMAVKGAGTLFPAVVFIVPSGAVSVYAPAVAGAMDELHLEFVFPL